LQLRVFDDGNLEGRPDVHEIEVPALDAPVVSYTAPLQQQSSPHKATYFAPVPVENREPVVSSMQVLQVTSCVMCLPGCVRVFVFVFVCLDVDVGGCLICKGVDVEVEVDVETVSLWCPACRFCN
jgi:hypothetical protein